MKIRYFGHYLKDKSSGACISFDMRNFLVNFTKFDHKQFKSNFSYQGENLYLFESDHQDVFIFVETRNTDFFKQIDKKSLTLSDLRNMISGQSELGYASYIIFRKDCFGICSTFMAPGPTAFCDFVNHIFKSLGITNLDFRVEPLIQAAKVEDVMSLSVVGRTSLEISRSNSIAQDICNVFGADLSNDLSLDSIEITFKPRKKANIKPIVSKVVESVDGSPDAVLKVRAKNFVSATLTDFYLGENGQLVEDVNYRVESDIPKIMAAVMSVNQNVAIKLDELRANAKVKEDNNIVVAAYNDESAWNSLLATLSLPAKA